MTTSKALSGMFAAVVLMTARRVASPFARTTQETEMKKFALAALLTATTLANAAGLDYKKEGAICDRKAGFCADHEGVSVALTKLYLGDKAEQKLMARINGVGVENFDASFFTMSGGLTCKTKEKTCWTNRYGEKIDTKATQTLFGR